MKKILKRGMSGLLAVLMAFTVLAGFGTTTAFAASETAESYMISFPRDGVDGHSKRRKRINRQITRLL